MNDVPSRFTLIVIKTEISDYRGGACVCVCMYMLAISAGLHLLT